MTNEEITKILENINLVDARLIEKQADEFLHDEIIRLKNNYLDDDEFQHRVIMDTFYASMLDVLTEKFPNLDKSVEHDIASWILGNEEEIGVFDLQKTWDEIELKIRLELSKL